jgi:hypothetical protein
MTANELRVGNLLQGDTIQNVNQGIYSDGVMQITGFGIHQIETGLIKLNPIPLTKDWLIRFGWIYNNETKTFEKYPNGDPRLHLIYVPTNNSWTMFNFVLKAMIAKRIWYVHQLQNIYFALIGEELTIKIETK